MSENFETSLVLDSRLLVTDKVNYAVVKGGG